MIYEDYKKIHNQLRYFVNNGHSVQLHIHSHWENSHFDGENWIFDHSHYKLQSFPKNEIFSIIKKYKYELEEISEKEVFTFRAGGLCIQPFALIKDALLKNNILIESSVINKAFSPYYDFRKTPEKTFWNFDHEPNIEQKDGHFLEVPIASIKVSQFFYWNLLFNKLIKTKKIKTENDGSPRNPNLNTILKWLFMGNYSSVSTDGLKSNLMIKALKNYEKKYSENQIFTIIGHPKTFNKYSFNNLENFFKYINLKHNSIDYNFFRKNIIQ